MVLVIFFRVICALLVVVKFHPIHCDDEIESTCMDQAVWCTSMAEYCDDHPVIQPLCLKTCNKCPAQKCGSNNNCEHGCEVVDEREVCTCLDGHALQDDGITCEDIDECLNDPCENPDTPVCVNTNGSFACVEEDDGCGQGKTNYYKREECCEITSNRCGRSTTNSIFGVGGRMAMVTRWPWMALVTVSSSTVCGGIIVHKDFVLVSAHCIGRASPVHITVLSGVANSRLTTTDKVGQERKVDEIILHPDYKFPVNDLALLRFTRSVEITDYVDITCLPEGEVPSLGTQCWTLGYEMKFEGGTFVRTLQQEAVNITEPEVCTNTIDQYDSSMLCGSPINATSTDCMGSLQGPLVCQRCSSCDWFVAGITALESGCLSQNSSGAFTSVSGLEEWVSKVVGVEYNKRQSQNQCKLADLATKQPTSGRITVHWGTWGPWEDCSATCGRSESVRRRKCVGGVPGVSVCDGEDMMTKQCERPSCSLWTEFEQWSKCSSSCNSGTRFRARKCLKDNKEDTGCVGERNQTETCNTSPCPRWGRWGKWSKCSQSCGGGKQSIERPCFHGTVGQHGCVGLPKRTRPCNRRKCPAWTQWTKWSKCSKTCGGGQRIAVRRCRNGKRTSVCEGKFNRTEPCNTEPCSGCTKWTRWSPCSVTCGVGERTRNRDCQIAKDGPAPVTKGRRSCKRRKCIESWTTWSNWTDCSVSCGGGTASRTRVCRGGDPGKGNCPGNSEMVETCNPDSCPLQWSSWTTWSACNVECGTGKRVRNRDCLAPSGTCAGPPFQEEACEKKCPGIDLCNRYLDHVMFCPQSAAWCTLQPQFVSGSCDRTCCLEELRLAYTPWTVWTKCPDDNCLASTQTRTRKCAYPTFCERFNETLEETRPCSTEACGARSGALCSASCGGGITTRRIFCLPGDPNCHRDGELVTEFCNTHPCQGVLSEWEEWGPCSQTCGEGSRKRMRSCTGGSCEGELEETEKCLLETCNGTWSQWGGWGMCSVQCGIGTIQRSRTCTGTCSGASTQEETCVTFDCPLINYSTCEDDGSMAYLCSFLTGYCNNGYMEYACRKTCGLC